MTLDEASRGSRVVVTRLEAKGAQRRRLMDLGLLPGVEVTVGDASPLGDPRSYRLLGTTFALRRRQARGIHVEPAEGP